MSLVSQRRIVQPDLSKHRSNFSRQESFEKNDDPIMDMSQSDKKHISQYALNNGTTGGSGFINVHHKSPVFEQLSQIVRRVRLRVIVAKLLNSTRSRMLKNMTNIQYSLISDKSQYFGDLPKDSQSHYYQHLLHTRGVFFHQFFSIVFKALSQIPLINPSSQLKFLWDLFIAGWMMYSLFIITVMVSFGVGEQTMHTKYLLEIILLVNTFDILLTCNTGFYKKGVLCKNRSVIWKKYTSDSLATDVFSLLPIAVFLMISRNLSEENQPKTNDFTFITLSLLFRIHTIIRVFTHTSQKYILQPNLRNALSLLSLALKILVIIHVWTCIWIFTGRMSEQISQSSWMRAIHLLDVGWEKQYLWAFYFSTVTMTTVGYGDIVPITPIEMIVCLVMLLFACGVFGFSVNTIQTILADFSRNQKDISQKMFIMKNYLYNKSINPALSKDVTEYLEYFWKMHQTGNQEEEQKMVKSLSDTLRRELLIESNRIVLKDCMIFQENFSEEVIKAMIPLIKEQHFTPEEVIYDAQDDEGTDHDRSIYFVSEGTVEVFLKTTTAVVTTTSMTACSTAKPSSNSGDIRQYKNLRRLKKGDVFGQVEFFTNLDRAMSVRSVNFSSLLCISRSDFVKMLRQFPEDYEQFQYIKDRLIQQKDFAKVHYKCNSCSSTSHNLSTCQYVHFIPNAPKILAVNNRSQIQQRNEIKVKRPLRKYARQQTIADAEEIAKNFQEFAEDLIEEYTVKNLQFNISRCDCCDIYQEIASAAIGGAADGGGGESQLSNNFNWNERHVNNCRVGSVQLDSRALAIEEYQQQQAQVSQYKAALKRHYLRNLGVAAHGFQDHFSEDASPNVRSLKLTPMFNKQASSKMSQQQQQTPKQQQHSEQQVTSFHKETMEDTLEHGEIIAFPVGTESQPMSLSQPVITMDAGNGNSTSKVVQQLKREWYQQSRPLGYANQYHYAPDPSSDSSLYPMSFQEQQSPLVAKSHYSNYHSQCYSMNNQDYHAAAAVFAAGGGVNASNQTHQMIQIFDIFHGSFETMNVFSLYYPLNNYAVVLKQLHMDEDQKRKLRTNLIEQQRQKTINILLKKKRQHNAPRASVRSIDQSLIKRIVEKFQKDNNTSNMQSNTQKEIGSVSCNTSEIKRNNTGQMSKQLAKEEEFEDGSKSKNKQKIKDKQSKEEDSQQEAVEVSYDSDEEDSSSFKSSHNSESKSKNQKESDKVKTHNNATQLSICSQVGISDINIQQNQQSLAHCILPSQSSNPEILGLDSLSFSMPFVLSRRNKASPHDQQANNTNKTSKTQQESNSKNNSKTNYEFSQQLPYFRHNTNPQQKESSSLSPKGEIDLLSLSSPLREQRIHSYDHKEKMIVNVQQYNDNICKFQEDSSAISNSSKTRKK